MNALEGKIVVVTGGSSGIGFQIAKDLYAIGAIVHIAGRRPAKLEEARDRIQTRDQPLYTHQCDVSIPAQVREMIGAIKPQGHVYGLVNNAGIPSRQKVHQLSVEHWNKTLAVNLTGAFLCSQAALEQMLEAGEGSIVNISSVGGITAFPNRTAYNVSKAGMISLTQSMALDYASQNIRVNSVCPGYVRTGMTEKWFDSMPPEQYEALVQSHALARLATTTEISSAVLFLLSPQSGFVTGHSLVVDGGYSIKRGC